MKKKTKKLLAIVVSSILMVLMLATMVNAAPYSYGEGISGGETQFSKYLVMPKETVTPGKTFTFEVTVPAATDLQDGSESKMPIYPGLNPELVTVEDAVFTSGEAGTIGTDDDGITNDTSKKYVEKVVKVNFSGVKFKEPGVYRYYITEADVSGCTPVTGKYRTLDVNVVNDTSASAAKPLKVESYVLYKGLLVSNQGKAAADVQMTAKDPIEVTTDGDKCDSIINKYPSQNLYVGKKVTGNQGSKDKYFKFTVTISNVAVGTKMDVDLTHATSTAITNGINPATTGLPSAGYTNPNEIEVTANDSVSVDFWLQNDQFVDILGLPDGAHYKVDEASYTDDGYVTTDSKATSFTITYKNSEDHDVTLTFDDETEGDIDVLNAATVNDICTGFTNEKDGTIPTGVILSVAPWVVAGIVILAGVVFFAIRSKRKYEEQ